MDKDRVTVGQLSLMLMLVIAGGKFLGLPGILAREVGHDSWLVLCVGFAADAVCLCFLLWAIKLNSSARLSFDNVLNVTLGKVVSKAVMTLLFVVYMSRSVMLLSSAYKMFAVTFDVNTNWIFFALPVVALAAFTLTRGFTALARVSQLLFVLITLSVLAMLANPLYQVKWGSLLPIAECGADKIFDTAVRQSYWFSDYIFIYFVIDKVRMKKHVFLPMLSVFVAGAAITVLMNIIFVTLYGSFAPNFELAMSKIGVFSIGGNEAGRWDWLTLSLWVMSVILKIILFIFCSYKSLEKIVGFAHDKFNWWAIGVIAAICMLSLFVSEDDFVSKFLNVAVYPFLLVQFVLPVVYPLLTRAAIARSNGGVHERT